jgi:hypothetical protein
MCLADLLYPGKALDARSLAHAKLTKSARAVLGADLMDGLRHFSAITYRIAATAVDVSPALIASARKLSPDARPAAFKGHMPLPAYESAGLALPTLTLLPASAESLLAEVVAKVGVPGARELLASFEQSQQPPVVIA